jgi:hypothetical protein
MMKSKLHALTLCACVSAAVAGTIAMPGAAHALVANVNVNGTNYSVTSFTGSYNTNTTRFTTAEMPWLGDMSFADTFAAAVATSLGKPNFSNYSPAFVWGVMTEQVNSSWFDFNSNAVLSTGFLLNQNITYAVIASAPAPSAVPGPLPLFGVAAAFGWSRRLRTRIAGKNASEATGRRSCLEASACSAGLEPLGAADPKELV